MERVWDQVCERLLAVSENETDTLFSLPYHSYSIESFTNIKGRRKGT